LADIWWVGKVVVQAGGCARFNDDGVKWDGVWRRDRGVQENDS
jgi:hypothetical protein